MMADLSDDFPKVAEMVCRVEHGADVVSASRYMPGGKQIGGPWLKGLLSRLAGVSLHRLTGLPTHDPTNSFKAYKTEFLRRTPIESTAGFCLGIELAVKARLQRRAHRGSPSHLVRPHPRARAGSNSSPGSRCTSSGTCGHAAALDRCRSRRPRAYPRGADPRRHAGSGPRGYALGRREGRCFPRGHAFSTLGAILATYDIISASSVFHFRSRRENRAA